jgi:hypothetical protein
MAHTKFANYTLDELLNLIDDKRPQSPLIDELCTRLEAGAAIQVSEDANPRVTCPVCEATLEAGYDAGNSIFTLKTEG